MTYDSLVTELKRYVQRGSTTADATTFAEIPFIINREERSLAREFKIQGYQQVVTSAFDPLQDGVLPKPVDWLNTISIRYGAGVGQVVNVPILPRSLEYLRSYWPDPGTRDTPEFYADYDEEHWLFAPSPDAAYPLEVVYYALLPLLDSANQTNWLTEHASDLMLNRCVISLGRFCGWKTDRLQEFKEAAGEAKKNISTQDLLRIIDRAVARRTS